MMFEPLVRGKSASILGVERVLDLAAKVGSYLAVGLPKAID
jgi:hypothetical protein